MNGKSTLKSAMGPDKVCQSPSRSGPGLGWVGLNPTIAERMDPKFGADENWICAW